MVDEVVPHIVVEKSTIREEFGSKHIARTNSTPYEVVELSLSSFGLTSSWACGNQTEQGGRSEATESVESAPTTAGIIVDVSGDGRA